MRYWLMKSEPDCFSIDDLARSPRQTTFWSGVRNYQARNFMRDDMRSGDRVFFYHSNAEPPAIAGLATVVREAYPDHTAWDKRDDHFDPKASPENPIWQMVDIRFDEKFAVPLPLELLRGVVELREMELLRRGSRLSVQPVSEREFKAVVALAASEARRAADGAAATGSNATGKRPAAGKRPAKAKSPAAAKSQSAKATAAKKPARRP